MTHFLLVFQLMMVDGMNIAVPTKVAPYKFESKELCETYKEFQGPPPINLRGECIPAIQFLDDKNKSNYYE